MCGTARRRLGELREMGCMLWISRQVQREFLATLSRPKLFPVPLSLDTILSTLAEFEASFSVAEDREGTMRRLCELLRKVPVGGRQIHDANIVATMLDYGVSSLLTNNMADFVPFGSFVELLPLG
jgi:predicted nucleic acid-binding protein